MLSTQSVIFSVVIKCLIDVKNLCFKLLPFKMFANFLAQKLNEFERETAILIEYVFAKVSDEVNRSAQSLFYNNYVPLNTHFGK